MSLSLDITDPIDFSFHMRFEEEQWLTGYNNPPSAFSDWTVTPSGSRRGSVLLAHEQDANYEDDIFGSQEFREPRAQPIDISNPSRPNPDLIRRALTTGDSPLFLTSPTWKAFNQEFSTPDSEVMGVTDGCNAEFHPDTCVDASLCQRPSLNPQVHDMNELDPYSSESISRSQKVLNVSSADEGSHAACDVSAVSLINWRPYV